MSGFDAFNNEISPEDDPAAEFLAREQDELAGLEDDVNFESSTLTTAESEAHQVTADYQNDNDFMGDGETDMFAFGENNEPLQMNGTQEPTPTLSSSAKPVVREEPEKICKWREEHQKMLERKDEEERLKKEEMHHTAVRELEEWYARYYEQIEKAKLNNRNAEKEYIDEEDTQRPGGPEWERIARMCDFNPKTSRGTKDTSRMRSIILQLKQMPLVRKPGVGEA
ncbi:clathrin light chain-like isoform X2 [Limulus polyphemus]|uniref:Clathrin light chain n=1 Tax=Limulus polyphemus TaxID=6850 RepID=A0ABM1BRD2_LIMPO|nr:clathrin light chain-like isoform X2 [Limulus polyphemus]